MVSEPVRGSKCSVCCSTGTPASSSSAWRSSSAATPRSRKRKLFMFLSSVLTPRPWLPTGRSEMLASQRRLPSSMFTSETPICLIVRPQQRQPFAGCGSVAQVGLGDDLDQRRAAPVEVDQRLVRAVDASRLRDVDELRRVLLEVDAMDAHLAEAAPGRQRDVVLADLVGLRAVGIEVVLAVKDRARRDLAAERERDLERELDRAPVGRPAEFPDGQGRSGRCASWARRRTRARSRRTSSSASAAGRGSRARSQPRSAPANR